MPAAVNARSIVRVVVVSVETRSPLEFVDITDALSRTVNGHAHCRAALLRASEYVAVSDGRLSLGRSQRVFLVDFDGGRRREVSLTLLGATGADLLR